MPLDLAKLCHAGQFSTEWAAENITLPPGESADSGAYDPNHNLVISRLFDWIGQNNPRELYLRKSSQCGASLHAMFMIIHRQLTVGKNAFLVADSMKIARTLADRLEGIIEASFKEEFSYRTHADKNIENKRFANGTVYTVGAGSAGALSSRNGPLGVADETDKHKKQTREANSIALLRQRLKTHPDSFLFALSTPTDEHGQISQLCKAAPAWLKYQIKCPICKATHELAHMWSYSEAWLICPHVNERLTEQQRKTAIKNGAWKKHGPGLYLAAQYNDLLNPKIKLETLSEEWKNAMAGLPMHRREFIQNRLGLPYSDAIDSEADLTQALNLAKRSDGSGGGEYILTVDVQDVTFKYMLSQRKDESSGLVLEILKYGETADIVELLKPYLGKATILVDDGGRRTWELRQLWAQLVQKGLRATKGASKRDRTDSIYWQGKFKVSPRDREPTLPIIWHSDKDLKAYTLQLFEGGKIAYPKGDIKDLMLELTAERPVEIQMRSGHKEVRWYLKDGSKNDWWDCLKLACLADYIRKQEPKRKAASSTINTNAP